MEKMASSVVDNNTGCTNAAVNYASIGGDCIVDNPTDRSPLPFPQRQA